MGQKLSGSAYNDVVLSMLALGYLILLLPWVATFAVQLAYSTSEPVTQDLPDADGAYPGTPRGGIVWTEFQDNYNGFGLMYDECEPWDTATSTSNYPNYNYSMMVSTAGYDQNLTWRFADQPFRSYGTMPCSTVNDEIGVRLTTDAFRVGPNNAMTKFNATWVKWSNPTYYSNANLSWYAEYDWWVEINGEYVFGESVRQNDADSYTLIDDWGGSSPAYYPTIHFEHNLSVDDENRVRLASAYATNSSGLNVTLHWECYGGVGEYCDIISNSAGNYNDDSLWLHVDVEYIGAEDYDLIIQGAAIIMGVLCLVIAIGSTPLWDPLKSRLGDM